MKFKGSFAAVILSIALLAVPLTTACASPQSVALTVGGSSQSTHFEVSFGYFHNSLSPYGHWVTVGNYGPCWRPGNMMYGWQPYYNNGYWAYTEYGWTWVSNEPWGDIAFHYGTWMNDPFYGWVWVPGYVWGPAWVTWMYNDNYIGWAPLPPTFRFGYRQGFVGRPVIVHNDYYIFVPGDRLNTANINTVRLPRERNIEIIHQARPTTTITVVNNHIVNHGPKVKTIERFSNAPVPIERVSREARINPMPIKVKHENAQIDLAAPALNRQQARKVIKDPAREEKAARADRARQLKEHADQPKINNVREKQKIEQPKPHQPRVQPEREKINRPPAQLPTEKPRLQNRVEKPNIQTQRPKVSPQPQMQNKPQNKPQSAPQNKPLRNKKQVKAPSANEDGAEQTLK